MDRGGEFTSETLQDHFQTKGIKWTASAPHTHQQNGRAEQLNHTLHDKAQSIRLDAGLPNSYWEFALLTTVHVYNRTPMSQINWKTPYKLFHKLKPSTSHFRVFGCGAYIFLPLKHAKINSPQNLN